MICGPPAPPPELLSWNILNSLDFVNGYKIEKFDSREVVYKINYLSNPKRFLKDIVSYDIIIDTTSTNWKIK